MQSELFISDRIDVNIVTQPLILSILKFVFFHKQIYKKYDMDVVLTHATFFESESNHGAQQQFKETQL